jgi:predicted nucleotidyltransferase
MKQDDREKIPFINRHQTLQTKVRSLYGFIFEKKPILSGFRGSIAHGLTIAPEDDEMYGIDDEDTFELYCYPPEYYLSLESYYHRGEVKDHKDEEDGTLHDVVEYEIRKAIHLLSGCNPNVMTYLYNRPEHYFEISSGGKMLIANRNIFLSKRRIYMAYSGYAYGQLKKLTVGAYQGYMGTKRKEIVEKIGYDTKNAMTLIRLLRNGQELLLTGEMQVFRDKDKDFLLSIKMGKLSMDEIQKLADDEFRKNEEAYKQSTLPEENKRNKINELLVDILREEHKT